MHICDADHNQLSSLGVSKEPNKQYVIVSYVGERSQILTVTYTVHHANTHVHVHRISSNAGIPNIKIVNKKILKKCLNDKKMCDVINQL